MKEIPILFSTPMVQAILEGRKGQTRRLINPQPSTFVTALRWGKHVSHCPESCDEDQHVKTFFNDKCRYGNPGDLLWVRETWAPYLRGTDGNGFIELIKYKADGAEIPFMHVKDYAELGWHYRPGIRMNKEYARIWLQKTTTKVERVCDISREDAIAEGLACISKDGGRTYKYGIPDLDGYPGTDNHGWPWQEWEVDPIEAFKKLWCKINGAETWNSWVWANSFNVLSTTGKPSLVTEKQNNE